MNPVLQKALENFEHAAAKLKTEIDAVRAPGAVGVNLDSEQEQLLAGHMDDFDELMQDLGDFLRKAFE